MNISTFKELDSQRLEELEEIFFLSSSVQAFENEEKKKAFFERWLGLYLEHHPQTAWLAHENDHILGYLVLWPDTREFLKLKPLESLLLFEDFYSDYPAHLHMNTHPNCRGRGVGAKLLEVALKEASHGIHLLTSPEARNVAFYERNGLTALAQRSFKGNDLLLMGTKLSS